jgi:LysM repeat protein
VEDGEGSITGAPDPGARGAETSPGTGPLDGETERVATSPTLSDEPHAWFRMAPLGGTDAPVEACRFLASLDGDGERAEAHVQVHPANVCVAIGDPAPQSARQQELVCLAAAHRNCPRYLRGILIEQTPPPPPVREPISRPVVAASLVLVAALAASFGFLAVRGSLTVALAGPSPGSSQLAIVPAASVAVQPSPSPVSSATPSVTPSATPSPSPSLSPTPTGTPAATPTPTIAPTPRPSSDRYAVLTACPSTPDCWIYVVRSGDNLVSIAHWFGVSLERIYEMNPWARTSGLRAGQELRIPTPTR